ncbi:Ig-like domain repeat protein [Aeromicrobium sp. IC_218]|uniref:Ig-like domain repeat protein n=1 Tax=Aeromicrobium sp. IC_218 TaxID=2545468 RepID=UPI0010E13322|nr:Ig-like domain repeat protein [Aeromicrobium sp. IC_218]TCI96352.1 hypothetical protein E0W78_14550 [Aeromicrobium sp. IC_218]
MTRFIFGIACDASHMPRGAGPRFRSQSRIDQQRRALMNRAPSGRSRPSTMKTSTAVGLSAALLAGFTTAATTSAAAAAPSSHSVLGPENPDWQKYILGPGTDVQRGVSVESRSGSVTNANGLVTGKGATTLTTTDATSPATVIIDWGVETAGRFTLKVDSSTGTPEAPLGVKISTSETDWGLYSATTLAAAAGEGDSVIKVTALNGTQLEPGRTIQIGDVKRKIVSVGTAGATGTGIELDEPLPKNFLYPNRTPVSVFAPTRIVGDTGSFGGVFSSQTQQVSAAGDVTFPANFGGFRFQAIQLTTPGSITISSNTAAATVFVADKDSYKGHFVSSDDQINKMWYSGAFSNAMTMVPKAESGRPYSVMMDGAKRDRAVWSGDVVIQGPVAANAFGEVANEYYEGALRDLLDNTNPTTGKLAGTTWRPNIYYYSDTYSNYTAIAAMDYYRYTGKQAWATEHKSKIEGALAYQKTKLNADGLVQNSPSDRDYWQAQLRGVVSEYNVMYYQTLKLAVWFEKQLGDTVKAGEYQADADALKAAIQKHLWSEELNAYVLGLDNEEDRTTIPLDANANALREGLVPAGKTPALLKRLEGGWTPYGSLLTHDLQGSPSRQDPTGQVLEPLPNYWEVLGRYNVGDDENALKVARAWWGQQVDEDHPYYTGATWEFLGNEGVMTRASASQSHGWGAGITNALTEFTVGIQPRDAGYRTWSVKPYVGGLDWAEGSVPLPNDENIKVRWGKDADEFDLKVESPKGTSGEVALPLPAEKSTVSANGKTIFAKGKVTPTGDVTGARLEGNRLVVQVKGGSPISFQADEAAKDSTVKVNASSSTYGKATTLVAKVAAPGVSNPTGTVTVTENGRKLASASVARGTARITLGRTSLSAGLHNLRVNYSGGGDAGGSESTVRVVTRKASTKVTTSVRPSKITTRTRPRVAIAVSATGVRPTGTVQVRVNGKLVERARLGRDGRVTVRLGRQSKGLKRVTVSYAGGKNFTTSSRTVRFRVR